MATKIFPAARLRLIEIWDYTEKKWGEDQADKYVRELVEAIDGLSRRRAKWRAVGEKSLSGAFFILHRHHYIFFREFASGMIGVVSLLHENMDLPSRLKEDAEQSAE